MGTTCCALHLLRGNKSADDVADAWIRQMQADGYRLALPEQSGQRVVFVIDPPESPWITLWEEGEMAQAPWLHNLRPAVRRLAKAANCTVLAAQVLDSDMSVCLLRLPGGAENLLVRGIADEYDCEPDEGAGDAAFWQEQFSLSGEERAKLEAFWAEDYVCEEERLFDLAQLLHIAPEQLLPFPEQIGFPQGCSVRILRFCAGRAPGKILRFPGHG